MDTGFNLELLDMELDSIEMDMEQFGLSSVEIDWSTVEDLTDETYEEPQHNMLVCPKCHHVDRDIHFKKMKGVEVDD